jgi:putative flippase GtrA
MYDELVGSYGQIQMRAPGETWRRALIRNASALRTDHVLAQGMRFVLSGTVVSIVYITLTTLLSAVVHLRFQVALVIGWSAAIAVHFTLQRTFVWANAKGFALSFGPQVRRYLLVAVSQLGVTALTTAVLPSVLGLSAEIIYLATAACLTTFNFLFFRHGVFHPTAGAPGATADASGST